MELSQYLESVREQVANVSALADEKTQQVAQRLSASLDSALRLSLIQALSDAAAEISADLAPTSVEVRMAGSDPEFVVHQVAEATAYSDDSNTDDDTVDDLESDVDEEEEPQARISLRLPASVKKRIDDLAAEEQISTNAWITRALMNHLRFTARHRERRGEGRGERRGEGRGERPSDGRGDGRGRRGRGGWGPGPWGPQRPGDPQQWPGNQGGPWGPGGPGRPPFPPGPPMAGGWGKSYQGWV